MVVVGGLEQKRRDCGEDRKEAVFVVLWSTSTVRLQLFLFLQEETQWTRQWLMNPYKTSQLCLCLETFFVTTGIRRSRI